jgi:hypothetical protein
MFLFLVIERGIRNQGKHHYKGLTYHKIWRVFLDRFFFTIYIGILNFCYGLYYHIIETEIIYVPLDLRYTVLLYFVSKKFL